MLSNYTARQGISTLCCVGIIFQRHPSCAGAMCDYYDDASWRSQGHESKVKGTIVNESVTSIGREAFYHCSSMTSIYFCGNTPSIGAHAFYNVSATAYYLAGNSTWTDKVKQDYQRYGQDHLCSQCCLHQSTGRDVPISQCRKIILIMR